MLGGKPQDKIAMLRELGKGSLILRGVKFIEGTAEMEPGFEPSFAALGEAIGLAEGTYVLYVAAEADKGVEPDTILARKRLQKVWAAVLVNGVPDQRIIAVAVLPVYQPHAEHELAPDAVPAGEPHGAHVLATASGA